MLKKILMFLMILFVVNFSYAGYTYNDSWTDIMLDSNGWCANLEITFQVWNETDYNDREDYSDNICERGCEDDCDWDDDPDCVECDRNCHEYDYIEDATIRIYDGPLDSLPLLIETTTNETGEFKYTFDEPQQHLLEIFPEDGNYNDFHQIYDLYECGNAQGKTIATEETPQDVELVYNTQGIILDVKDSLLNETTDFTINEDVSMPKALENEIKHFEITAESADFSKITMKVRVDKLNDDFTTELKRYNPSTRKWDDVNYQNLNTDISFDATKLGIYAITQSENEVIEEVVETPVESESENVGEVNDTENTQSNSDDVISNKTDSSFMSNKNLMIGGGLGGLLLLIIILFVFSKNKGSKGHYHEKKDSGMTTDKQVLTTYEATYKQAKEYVKEHKDTFGKDSLYRALEGAKVPKDIIDKVFNEEY